MLTLYQELKFAQQGHYCQRNGQNPETGSNAQENLPKRRNTAAAQDKHGPHSQQHHMQKYLKDI